MESIKATMLSVRYRNPEHTWLVAQMKLEGTKESFIATGDIPYSETEEPVQLYGEWIQDKKYGKQFKVSTAHRVLPTTVSGLRNYLAASEDIKGVGPIRADALAKHFGAKLLSVLDKQEPKLLTAVNGINLEIAKRITYGWSKDSAIRQLGLFLAKSNMSPRWANRILKQWDAAKAIENIQRNPYSLTQIDGIGFITADEIAKEFGYKIDSPERIAAAVVHVVSQGVQEGNVFLFQQQLIEGIVKLVHPRGKNEEKIRKQAAEAVNQAIENKELIAEEVSDGFITVKLLYLPHLYTAEKSLAECIAERSEYNHTIPSKLESVLKDVQDKQQISFSQMQVAAIRGVFSNNTMVITGGPGTGKTTCVKAIFETATKLQQSISLSAPTGRAAKRLSEVTGCTATTIHRLLKWREGKPTHNAGNRIDADILIIDESSMLDLELATKLFTAIPNHCRVVFIGDTDQLPAIAAGNTLRDIMVSKMVPTVCLDTIFRQAEASLIVRNSHLIRKGGLPRFPETKGTKEDTYVMWIPHNTNPDISGKDDTEWLKNTLAKLASNHIPSKFGDAAKPIDPIRDIQVLVPMKKGTIGSFELNKVLQQALNPNKEEIALSGKVFRIGDRVMQTKNNYDEGIEVYNGDIGFITDIKHEDKSLEIDFYGRIVQYPFELTEELQLAYCQTIHKSQGSEYPIVIVVMGYQHWAMLERNLLYTANTRAKKLCLFLASKGAIERAVKNNPVKNRNTYLAQRIRAYMKAE
jgi:exodeoxyribonuclease V alpha subunit